MARPLRIELAGGLYHVMSFGDRQEIHYVGVRMSAWDADRQCGISVDVGKGLPTYGCLPNRYLQVDFRGLTGLA